MQIHGILKAKALDEEHLVTDRWWDCGIRGDNRRQEVASAIGVAGGTSSQIGRDRDGWTGLTTHSTRMTAEGRRGRRDNKLI
jgi:hypothetical protein